MVLPSWTDEKFGTMKRAGLWLVTVVGEGSIFTKDELRQAFPGVSQIDRRMRDLRDHGWQIDTNREDASLASSEQRFVRQGEPVWEPGKGRVKSTAPVTATQRREIMAKDGNFCRSCGISGGQTFAGTYEAAQLDIARRQVRQPDGELRVELVTECNRCRVGGRQLVADPADVLAQVRQLGRLERRVLAGWVTEDRRPFSTVERLWADYRALPEESRAKIRQVLEAEGTD
uniref:HNH endonuclease n=1 Tax=Streptomyces sp. NBC_00003 TaxID=2903608 RepID=A0AAU2V9H5_9ACTN